MPIYFWISSDVFGKPFFVNGIESSAIPWRARGSLVVGGLLLSFLAAGGAWLYSNNWLSERLAGLASTIPIWVVVLFALLLWLGITTLLSISAGWYSLQRAYPKPIGEPEIEMRLKWSMMGKGVTQRNILTLGAYQDGLGMRMNRLFGAFSRPVAVPWKEISVNLFEEANTKLVKLTFGEPSQGSLVMRAECWSKIEPYFDPMVSHKLPPSPRP